MEISGQHINRVTSLTTNLIMQCARFILSENQKIQERAVFKFTRKITRLRTSDFIPKSITMSRLLNYCRKLEK